MRLTLNRSVRQKIDQQIAGEAIAIECAKRDQLRAKGLEVTDIVDHGWAKSIYFSDPNGLSLEYCCLVRDLTEDDAVMQERGTIPRARLDFNSTTSATTSAEVSRVPSARGKVTA
jgi:hypothetical protein